jgi:hypothetical protein
VCQKLCALASAPYLGRKLGVWGVCNCTFKSGPTLIQMHPNLEGGCKTQYKVKLKCHMTCMDPWEVRWCEPQCKIGQLTHRVTQPQSSWCVQHVQNIVPPHVQRSVKGFGPIQSVPKVMCIGVCTLFEAKTGCWGYVQVYLQTWSYNSPNATKLGGWVQNTI